MKLLIGQQMVMPALESVRLGKTRNEAAACLTATVLIAPADTYFLKLSVAVEDVVRLLDMYQKRDLKNPAVIVDANHSNSNKQYKEQIRIVSEVLHSRRHHDGLKQLVKGVMIESYLEEGTQPIDCERVYGKSITDPCLGWDDTEALLYRIADEC